MDTTTITEDQFFAAIKPLLTHLEGPILQPYLDAKGIVTVGIGINLSVETNAAEYFRILGITNATVKTALEKVFNTTFVQKGTLTAKQQLDAALTGVANKPNLTLTPAQNNELFQNIGIGTPTEGGDATTRNFHGVASHYAELAVYLRDKLTNPGVLDTREGLALQSLEYGGDKVLRKAPTLTGALNQGDKGRARAWWEIAFDSNGEQADGVAKRRYVESAVFGLYDPKDKLGTGGSVPLSEALTIYQTLSTVSGTGTLLQKAVAYEAAFGRMIDGYDTLHGKGGTAHQEGANDILKSSDIENTALAGIVATTLSGNLAPAAATLVQHFIFDKNANPYVGTNQFQVGAFNPLDVQVAVKDGGDTLTPLTHPQPQNPPAPNPYANQALLVAQGGEVTLDGTDASNAYGSVGNYALIGGIGNDLIYVGDGNDYIVAGTGDTVISGGAGNKPMGSGNDTIVLGAANKVGAGGNHTVWGGTGEDTYYISLKNSDVLHLSGDGHSTVNIVSDSNPLSYSPIEISGKELSPVLVTPNAKTKTYLDAQSDQLLFSTQAADHTTTLRMISLKTTITEPPSAMRTLAAAAQPAWSELADGIVTFFQGLGDAMGSLGTSDVQNLYDQFTATDTSAEAGTGILEIDGYDGSNLDGVTLDDNATPPAGTPNLDQLGSEANPSGGTNYSNGNLGNPLSSIIGSDFPDGASYAISGSGYASYIQNGKGTVASFLGDIHYSATTPTSVDVQGTIQGNTGTQYLIGVGNGHETLMGGAAGENTSLWTTIDAGGADALLIGGGQNSMIWGGTGHDTIVAGSSDSTGLPYDPVTLAVAGLSFYGQQWHHAGGSGGSASTDTPMFSVAAMSDPANFQVQIQVFQSDGTYHAAENLLGSSYDPGSLDGESTLPGSVMIGGSGFDMLIGNTGDDTITGGDPSAPQAGIVDEILVGGAGSDVIYGGSGTEIIFADMSPGASSGWANLDATHSDTIYGGSGNAYIYGSGADNVIHGGTGNYTIFVGNGNSYVETGDGNTIVHGGTGNNFIVAGSGNDSIETGDGNTYVYGGDGQSTVIAGAGDDTFEAGFGTTRYQAGAGHEVLLIGGVGDDQRLVNSAQAASVEIRFTPDVDVSDVIARRDDSRNLQLIDQSTGRTLVIEGYFNDGSAQDNIAVVFADGTRWVANTIIANSMIASTGDEELWGTDGDNTIVGGMGNDTISGLGGNDVLMGGSANNTIIGGSGNSTITGGDGTNYLYGGPGNSTIEGGAGPNHIYGASGVSTYVFELGNGSDTIAPDYMETGSDTLRFGAGIDRASVAFSTTHNGTDLIVTFGGLSPSTIVVSGFFHPAAGSHQLSSFQFADGSSLSAADVSALAASNYSSDNGNNNISGGSGDSHIFGGSGSDTLTGGTGNATIVGGSGIELIVGGSGTNLLVGGSGYDTIRAGSHGDTIQAGSGIAQITTGDGNDSVSSQGALATLAASTGSDTYAFGLGSGQLELSGEASYATSKGGTDTIQIAAGLTSADLTFTRIGDEFGRNALVIGIKGTEDYFRVDDYFYRTDPWSEPQPLALQIQFANGDVMSYQDILSDAEAASSWNGAVTDLAPASAQDYTQADYFGRGDGARALAASDNITPENEQAGITWEVRLRQGVRQQDISLQAKGTDILITIRGTNDTLLLPGMLNVDVEGYAATQLTFADGSVWDLDQIIAHTNRGPGPVSAESLGDNQTIGFSFGDGQKIVNVSDSSGNAVVFGAGIRSTDIDMVRTAHGIEFILKATGETLTLVDASGNSDQSDDGNGEEYPWQTYPVESVKFADGAVWETRNIHSFLEAATPVEELESHTPRAPSSTDLITTGLSDNEVYVGTGDSLVLIGNGYEDTEAAMVIHAGVTFGNTTIEGSYNGDGSYGLGDSRVVHFDQGMALSDLIVSRTFNDSAAQDPADASFNSDGSGSGTLRLTSRTTGHSIDVPYGIELDGDTLRLYSSITGLTFDDGSAIDIDTLIHNASIDSGGMIEGVRGSATLKGPDGSTIHAALGNTVVVGSHQHIGADLSNIGSVRPVAGSTYVLGSGSTDDFLVANIYSKVTFDYTAQSTDFGVIRGQGGQDILFRKDSGSFISLTSSGTYIGDGSGGPSSLDIELDFSDRVLKGQDQYEQALAPSVPVSLLDVQGRHGYYIDEPNSSGYTAYVRGAVSNQVFDGLAWSHFDASQTHTLFDTPWLNSNIDSATNNAPVNFTFVAGLGDSEIVNYDSGRLNIDMSPGIGAGDVSVNENGTQIEFSVTSADGRQDRLNVDNFYTYSADTDSYTEKQLTLHFADGTSWSNADIHSRIEGPANENGGSISDTWIVDQHEGVINLPGDPESSSASEVTIKTDAANTFLLGNVRLDGARGENTFEISRSSQAFVGNFDTSRDSIQLIDGLTTNDVGVTRSNAWVNGSYVDGLILTDRITGRQLLNVSGPRLFLDDTPAVTFDDGTSWSFAELVRSAPFSLNAGAVASYIRGDDGETSLSGTAGSDIIAAGAGPVTIDGDGGSDTLYAGAGDDTFVFGSGYGHATIVGMPGTVRDNVLDFGQGISASGVEVIKSADSSDIELRLTSTGDSVVLANLANPSGDQAIQTLQFADGTQWSASDILQRSYEGGTVAKTITADAAHRSIAGGSGNETIVGDEGQDTLAGGGGQNTLRSGGGNNRIQLAAGTDTVYGGDGTDVIVMGSGTSVVYGGAGAEAYVYGAGFGNSTVYAADNAVANDIQFTDGIRAQDVSFAMAPDGSLHITTDGNQGTIVLPAHEVGSTSETDVGTIFFADGTAASMASIDALLLASAGSPVHAKANIVNPGLPAAYDPANSIHVAGSAQVRPSAPSHLAGSSQGASTQDPGDWSWLSAPSGATNVAKPAVKPSLVTSGHSSIGAGDIHVGSTVSGGGDDRTNTTFKSKSDDTHGSSPAVGGDTKRISRPHAAPQASVTDGRVAHGDPDIRIHGRLGATVIRTGAPTDHLANPQGSGLLPSDGGNVGHETSRESLRNDSGADAGRRRRSVAHTADTADAMVKALAAQEHQPGGAMTDDDEPGSRADRTLALLGQHGTGRNSSHHDDAMDAHERMIQAMAAFAAVPAGSGRPPAGLSDADAITLAVHGH